MLHTWLWALSVWLIQMHLAPAQMIPVRISSIHMAHVVQILVHLTSVVHITNVQYPCPHIPYRPYDNYFHYRSALCKSRFFTSCSTAQQTVYLTYILTSLGSHSDNFALTIYIWYIPSRIKKIFCPNRKLKHITLLLHKDTSILYFNKGHAGCCCCCYWITQSHYSLMVDVIN